MQKPVVEVVGRMGLHRATTEASSGHAFKENDMELKLNTSKMGMKPRGESWEWYTAKVGKVAHINVHNRTMSGSWTWGIYADGLLESRKEYDTKELAFVSAKNSLKLLLEEAMADF
jgi:hypothetical protein